VGNVTAFAPAERLDLAVALAEHADRPIMFPGLGSWRPNSLRLVVAGDGNAFRRLGRGRVPEWGMGLAFPRSGTVVIRADAPDPRAALRHELAHLALHDHIRSRVPLWFDEGYAVVAAGEFGRLQALELNLAVVRGAVPDLRALDAALRRGAGEAEAAYALAGSAVLHLLRLQPDGSLAPLLRHLAAGEPFDAAVSAVSGYDLSSFDRSWRQAVRRRYGWLVWFVAGGLWATAAVAVVALVLLRRHRDRPRRAALDEGWTVPPEEGGGDEDGPAEPLDRVDASR
jgi:hypothetical protein